MVAGWARLASANASAHSVHKLGARVGPAQAGQMDWRRRSLESMPLERYGAEVSLNGPRAGRDMAGRRSVHAHRRAAMSCHRLEKAWVASEEGAYTPTGARSGPMRSMTLAFGTGVASR